MEVYAREDAAIAQTPIVPAKKYLGSVDHLYDLARNSSSKSRIQLAYEISVILEADISFQESEMVADVLITLLHESEKDVRKALSFRLSLIEKVPLRLILELANDDIDIATPVLISSPVLSDYDLMYIIKAQGASYWRLIAKRKALADRVTEMLAGTRDVETALTLLENEDIVLSESVMMLLSDLAQEQSAVAMPLLERDEMSEALACRLFFHVGEDIKRWISKRYRISEELLTKSVDHVVKSGIEEPTYSAQSLPDAVMMEETLAAKDKGFLTIKMMIGTLRRSHIRSFVAQFSVFTGVSVNVLIPLLKQDNGQGLAVLSRAFDVSKQDFISLFMLTSKFWKNGQFVHPDDIRRALKYYDAISFDFASDIIKSYRPV